MVVKKMHQVHLFVGFMIKVMYMHIKCLVIDMILEQ